MDTTGHRGSVRISALHGACALLLALSLGGCSGGGENVMTLPDAGFSRTDTTSGGMNFDPGQAPPRTDKGVECLDHVDCEGKAGSDQPCREARCDGGACVVIAASDGATCEDGDPCTAGDACSVGVCRTGALKDCDDGNPCTVNGCDPADGTCQADSASTEGTECSDGDACTTGDICTSGACAGEQTVCDDGDACTNDSCDARAGGCVFQPAGSIGSACDDGDACTTADLCSLDGCSGTRTVCDDSEACTVDSCDPVSGWNAADELVRAFRQVVYSVIVAIPAGALLLRLAPMWAFEPLKSKGPRIFS